jgi:ATP/maltotriose-dependent transcriptional regulator MalT
VNALGQAVLIVSLFSVGYLAVYLVLKRKLARALSAAAILGEVREEVNRILVELNQTTNRNITLIEDRIRSLNELLGKADKRIALMQREAEKQELASRLYSELSSRRPAPAEEPPAPAAPPPEEREGADRNEEVLRLARSGLSPALIARQLSITLGEVELIISLAQRAR